MNTTTGRFVLAIAVSLYALSGMVACGEMGPPGEPGPIGPPGAPAVSIPVLAWVDATNSVVSTTQTPLFVDAVGVHWSVSADTGEMTLSDNYNGVGAIYYETPDCEGAGHVTSSHVVGVGFRVCGDPPEMIRFRGASDTSAPRRIYSAWATDGAGGCRCVMAAPGFSPRTFSLPQLRAIPAPPPAVAGPLRLVPLQ